MSSRIPPKSVQEAETDNDTLFEIVRVQVVGTIHDDPKGKHPIAAAMTLIGDALAAKGTPSDDRMQFTWRGHTYTVTVARA